MPGHGNQICARAPTKGNVQTGAQAACPGTKSEQGLRRHSFIQPELDVFGGFFSFFGSVWFLSQLHPNGCLMSV